MLYTFGGTPADVLTNASGDVVPDYPLLVRVAGTGQLVTALYEVDGVTPIGELRTNPLISAQPGAVRPFKTDVPAIEFEYLDAAGNPVRWYEAGREVAQEALAEAQDSLSKTDGGTVSGPLTAAGGASVETGLSVTGGANVDELAVAGDLTVGGRFESAGISLAGMQVYNPRVMGAVGDGVADDAPAVQAALDAAYAAGGGRVIVPPGDYRLATLPLRPREPVELLLMPGARFIRAASATMLLNGDSDQVFGGYTGHGNITVQGGVWDMQGTTPGLTASRMCISIGHARNITIRDIEVRDLPGYHAIELNSTKNALVENCRFLGYVDPDGTRSFSEAIQLDLAKSSGAFGGFGPYDNVVCEDITIRDCYVGASGTPGTTAWPRGIGSHSATVGTSHKRIKIVHNTFEGCLQYGVVAYAYDDSVIAENTMRGCGAGIRARTIISSDAADSTNVDGVQTNGSQVMKNLVVADNVITDSTGYDDAILLYGESTGRQLGASITGNTIEGTTNNENGIRVFYAEQYTVTGNVIRGVSGTGISQEQVTGGDVAANRIYAPGSAGVSCDTGSDMTIAANAVREAGGNGLWIIGGSDIRLQSNSVKGASRAGSGSYGIRVSSATDGLLIAGNRVRNMPTGANPTYGLSLTNTCTNVRRYGNDLTGSGTSGALDDQSVSPEVSALDAPLASFTATVTGGGSATFTAQGGDAVRLGNRLWWVNISIEVNAAGSGTGNVAVALPFTPDRSRQQTLNLHCEGVNVASQATSGAAVILKTGAGAVIDRIRTQVAATGTTATDNRIMNVTGANLLAGAVMTMSGILREA